MLKEALDRLISLGQEARTAKVIPVPNEPPHVFWMQDGSGVLKRYVAESPLLKRKFLSIRSLMEFCRDNLKSDGPDASQVWYSREGVAVLFQKAFDSSDRWIRSGIELSFSPQFIRLQELEECATTFQQVPLIELLRIELADCFAHMPDLVKQVRSVKWLTSEDGESSSSQGRASVGKKITSELTNLQNLPEDISLDVPIFDGYRWRAPVRCSLEARPQGTCFCLRPLAGQLEAAIRSGEQSLNSEIVQCMSSLAIKDVPVYYGTPG